MIKTFVNRSQKLQNLLNGYWFVISLGGATCYWTLTQINHPYVIDEAAFPYAAHGVAEHGNPHFYNGETRPNDLGIWHPPLYVYLLGIWIKLLGFGHFQVRAFGYICMALTCFFIYKTVRLFESKSNVPSKIAVAFYGTHYFVTQSSLIPDIDGTLEPLVITLALYATSRVLNAERITHRQIYFIIFSLTVSFSTKLTTPLLLALPIFVIFILRKFGLFKATAYTFALLSCGVMGFLVWWLPVAYIEKLDWTFPFRFTIESATSKNSQISFIQKISQSLHMPTSTVSWLGTSTFFVLIYIVKRSLDKKELKDKYFGLTILAFSIFSWLVYDAITGAPFTFPKYWNIGLVGVAIALGIFFPNISTLNNTRNQVTLSVLAFVVFVTVLISCKNSLAKTHSFTSLNLSLKMTLFVAILLLSSIYILSRNQGRDFSFALGVSLLVCVISINSAVNTDLARVQFSTRYYFGESGMQSVLTWLHNNAKPESRLFAPKDIGLESGMVFFEDAQILASVPTSEISHELEIDKVNLIIIRNLYDYSPQIYPEQLAAAVHNFKQVKGKDFIDFQIWEKNVS